MEALINHSGLVAVLDQANVDTDQIIPKQFLKRIERTGFGKFLFFDWRFNEDGTDNPDFILNQERYQGASILLAGPNFGCGSSREHAPWSLSDYGFKVIIAPSFADIFYSNCFKNAMLPIRLSAEQLSPIVEKVLATPGYQMTVDLEKQLISGDPDISISFKIDPIIKQRLLKGLDDIGLSLQKEHLITAYEERMGK
jgi:3-isopropylmalate/(R)-2-methylmalate dehydratase small subunit